MQPLPATTRRLTDHPARWVCACVGVVLACAGLVFGRADVTLLGVPLILMTLWPAGRTAVDARLSSQADCLTIDGGDQGVAPGSETPSETPAQTGQTRSQLLQNGNLISKPANGFEFVPLKQAVGVDVVRLRLTCPGHQSTQLVVPARRSRIDVQLHSVRTGPQPGMVADWDAHGPFLMSSTDAKTLVSEPRVVLPSFMPLQLVPESQRLRGLTGPAPSNRAGDGFEMRDVHAMGPADSSRRIDWKVTARQPAEQIWVKGTYATGEAVAVLIVDSRDEVGSDLHTWYASVPLRVDEPTSLDLARHAAASVARRLIEAGNRVGLADLAAARRLVPPATGRRHLNRLIYALALSAPIGKPSTRVRPPQLPAEAIVYIFSTLLDDESVRLARTCKNLGHQVVVVDTLPQVRPAAEISLEVAWRVMTAERAARIRRLAAEHIPVVAWGGGARALAEQRLAAIRRQWAKPEARR